MTAPHDLPDNSAGFDSQEVLHPEVYRALRTLAGRHMALQRKDQTLQPTVLVHEAWLRLAKRGRKWRNRGHFYAEASLAMRHILIDHARRKSRLCRGGGLLRKSSIALHELAVPESAEFILAINEGISELEKVHPQRAQIVVDRFFGGLTNAEIARSLGISERSVERHWAMAKVWLLRWIQQASTPHERTVA